jgi:hypothetical protein
MLASSRPRVSHLNPGDFVFVQCACGRTELLTKTMLTAAGLRPDHLLADLGRRLRCRQCNRKGQLTVSIKWAGASV